MSEGVQLLGCCEICCKVESEITWKAVHLVSMGLALRGVGFVYFCLARSP